MYALAVMNWVVLNCIFIRDNLWNMDSWILTFLQSYSKCISAHPSVPCALSAVVASTWSCSRCVTWCAVRPSRSPRARRSPILPTSCSRPPTAASPSSSCMRRRAGSSLTGTSAGQWVGKLAVRNRSVSLGARLPTPQQVSELRSSPTDTSAGQWVGELAYGTGQWVLEIACRHLSRSVSWGARLRTPQQVSGFGSSPTDTSIGQWVGELASGHVSRSVGRGARLRTRQQVSGSGSSPTDTSAGQWVGELAYGTGQWVLEIACRHLSRSVSRGARLWTPQQVSGSGSSPTDTSAGQWVGELAYRHLSRSVGRGARLRTPQQVSGSWRSPADTSAGQWVGELTCRHLSRSVGRGARLPTPQQVSGLGSSPTDTSAPLVYTRVVDELFSFSVVTMPRSSCSVKCSIFQHFQVPTRCDRRHVKSSVLRVDLVRPHYYYCNVYTVDISELNCLSFSSMKRRENKPNEASRFHRRSRMKRWWVIATRASRAMR